MLSYVLIGLSLVLLGIVGLQFTYMFYLDRIHHERRKHINALEKKCADLSTRLETAEARVAQLEPFLKRDDEIWADVLEDL
jgi:hypothetical protein